MITNLGHGISPCGENPDGQLSWVQMYDNTGILPYGEKPDGQLYLILLSYFYVMIGFYDYIHCDRISTKCW